MKNFSLVKNILFVASKALLLVACLNACSMQPLSFNPFHDQDSAVVADDKQVVQQLKLALEWLAQEETAKADTAFKQMMALGARSPSSLNHYAVFLREQWKIDDAEKIYLQALQHSPENAMTHWNIAVLYELYQGDFKQALEHFQQYKKFASNPDKRIDGWIADLKRRVKSQQEESEGETA